MGTSFSTLTYSVDMTAVVKDVCCGCEGYCGVVIAGEKTTQRGRLMLTRASGALRDGIGGSLTIQPTTCFLFPA